MSSMDFGDLPTWVSAASGMVALTFASIAAISAKRLYEVESRRDRQTEADRESRLEETRSEQSRRISAWYGKSPDSERYGVYVRNPSDLPIYQLTLQLFRIDHDFERAFRRIQLDVLAPRDEPQYLPLSDFEEFNTVLDFRVTDRVGIRILFTDASGNKWCRDPKGKLTRQG